MAKKQIEHHANKLGHLIGIADVDAVSIISKYADAWLDPAISAEGKSLHWMPVELGRIIFYPPSVSALFITQEHEEFFGSAFLTDVFLAFVMTRRDQVALIHKKRLFVPEKAKAAAKRFARTCGLSSSQIRSLIFSMLPSGDDLPDPDAPVVEQTGPISPHILCALLSEYGQTEDQLLNTDPEKLNLMVETMLSRSGADPEAINDHNRRQYFFHLTQLVNKWKAENGEE